jgi:hypothetical protein
MQTRIISSQYKVDVSSIREAAHFKRDAVTVFTREVRLLLHHTVYEGRDADGEGNEYLRDSNHVLGFHLRDLTRVSVYAPT